MSSEPEKIRTTCCIAGGGPAGMMLGFLLARAGVKVIVLEKHRDFFRDFRGDTIHPSTLEVMNELGLLDHFLKLPHQELRVVGGRFENAEFIAADFSHLPVKCKFVALMPQWDFLNFLAREARRYPSFQLKMECEAKELIREGDRVVGARATTPEGELEILADLVVAADGRHSDLRLASKLEVMDFGAPIDVMWMRISKRPGDPAQTLGYLRAGQGLVLLDRGDYWQCGFIIPKGMNDAIRSEGLESLRKRMSQVAPFLEGRLVELKDWDEIKLLSVQVNRLKKWFLPGFLCIGDAAHAMSPAGGVGINLAIQDAVAAANILAAPLRAGTLTEGDLHSVQKRREFPTRLTQRMQIGIQNRVFKRVIGKPREEGKVPIFVKLFARFPFLRRIPARLIGMGFRPEHIHTPEVLSQ